MEVKHHVYLLANGGVTLSFLSRYFTSTETIKLIGDGGDRRWGKREIIYLSLHCYHQNDSCIKMGSDDSHHFNVSLNVRDTVTRQCPHTTTFFEEKGETKRNQAEAHLLG